MGSPAQRLPERVVLVVDDEDLVRRMTTRALTDAGYRVLEAHDGEEAALAARDARDERRTDRQ
jgi:CheY-like chemotaxis protein